VPRPAAETATVARVFAAPATAGGAADRLLDALAGAHAGLLAAAVALHVGGQVCRGLAWRGVLAAAWPGVTRRRACAWHVCGAGLSGVLSARGGDAVRIALARRQIDGASWPALAGTLAVEGSFETLFAAVVALLALRFGVGSLALPPAPLLAGVVLAGAALVYASARSARVRRLASDVGRGLQIVRRPRCWASRVLPWQVAGRVLRLGAATCFLLAFGLPAAPAVVLAACAAQGSGGVLPLPGAGPATVAGALLVALPLAAGHPVDPAAVAALAIVQPAALTATGVAISLALLAGLCGARTPRALAGAVRSLRAAEAPPAPKPATLAP
jgi:Lysylphosphatidylglycerol synthase TM region